MTGLRCAGFNGTGNVWEAGSAGLEPACIPWHTVYATENASALSSLCGSDLTHLSQPRFMATSFTDFSPIPPR